MDKVDSVSSSAGGFNCNVGGAGATGGGRSAFD